MKKPLKSRVFFSPPVFGLFIGLAIFLVFFAADHGINLFHRLDNQILDFHFKLRVSLFQTSSQEGVVEEIRSPKISPDILIVGIDESTLDTYGRWPFPRFRHADLIKSFTRIQQQHNRESAIFLDILFNEIGDRPYEDVLLIDAIAENDKTLLQVDLGVDVPVGMRTEEYNARFEALELEEFGAVFGDLDDLRPYYGIATPLVPYARATALYGHANFSPDYSETTYKHLQVIIRYSEKFAEHSLDALTPDFVLDAATGERLAWMDESGRRFDVKLPLNERSLASLRRRMEASALPRAEDRDGDGIPETFTYFLSVYKDHLIPSTSLTLAMNYFGKSFEDLEIHLGSHILIPSPRRWDPVLKSWVPYSIVTRYPEMDEQGFIVREGKTRTLDELRIPIDDKGRFMINYMGSRSNIGRGAYTTYPVRPYVAYARRSPGMDPATWPRTKGVGGKIILVGAFAQGMAADEKPTPLGLMFGVEMHANALNTIIMDNFIRKPPMWVNSLILLVMIMAVAVMGTRMNTGLAFLSTFLVLILSFVVVHILFDQFDILFDWAGAALGMVLTFIAAVVYRVLFEERDKRHVKDMFGKYISPVMVERMMHQAPELGGDDVEMSVFFSDIRSFSTFSEHLPPQELVDLLNEYFTAMTDTLMRWNGTLDKYIGDAVMAFWGAPLNQKDHALFACKCAIEQLRILDELNANWPEHRRFQIGIGINSGVCTVGNMGSQGRLNYTVMGDQVNLASRLEGANKQYSTRIIISESTKKHLEEEPFLIRELDDIRVKGRSEPVTIYELVDYEKDLTPPGE